MEKEKLIEKILRIHGKVPMNVRFAGDNMADACLIGAYLAWAILTGANLTEAIRK
jgi:uncharacterized protein YjbI with pentapeptide repeats